MFLAKKNCLNCQKEFQAKNPIRKHCSSSCTKEYKRKLFTNRGRAKIKIEPKNCENCETIFIKKRRDQRFCNNECKIEYHKNITIAKNHERLKANPNNCSYCKKDFIAVRGNQLFCSELCGTNWRAEKRSKKAEVIRNSTIKICPICNKEFTPKKTLKEIHCSKRCRESMGKKIYKMMDTCYKRCGTKKADHSHKILGYTANELLIHLKKFGNWETLKLGSWHLDHVFPIVAFVRNGITDPKIICCLDNLQPLVGSENCSKNDVYDEKTFAEWLESKQFNLTKV